MSIDTAVSSDLSARVAEEIRVVMARRLIKQSQLAKLIGVNDQWLSVRLRGIQEIGLNDLAMIAKALGVQPGELLGVKGDATDRLTGTPHKARSIRPRDSRPPKAPTASRRPSLMHQRTRA